ncbi:hypothetical protein PWT90_08905 [Aphanocladium album]|nr:hypothetical protein PWT90_08905 [Aphanocladium album]
MIRSWNERFKVTSDTVIAGTTQCIFCGKGYCLELAKPVEQRQDWLMWVDADSIILNPAIPPTIFLPPTDISDIHFIASKDQNGLNNGIVFLRVHPWTVSMLLETAGNPLFHPEIDLGWSADQTSMANVLAKEEGGFDGTGYKRHGIYMPRIFFNAYQFGHGFEGDKGNLLVHLPGMTYTEKWDHMGRWLDILEGEGGREWEVSLEESGYENKTISFWNVVRDVKREIQETESAIGSMAEPMAEPKAAKRDAVNKLKKVLWEEADDVDLMRRRLSELVSLK